jgi:hypothetical protein
MSYDQFTADLVRENAALTSELSKLRDAVAWLGDIHVDAREQQRRYLAFFAEAHAKVDGKWIDPNIALIAAHEEARKQ